MISVQLSGFTNIVPIWQVWTYIGVYIAAILAFYVLRSIGLFVLAKRNNVDNAFLAWIPLVWFFIACKLCGKTRFFGKQTEKIALVLTIIFSVSNFLTFATQFLIYFPIAGNFLMGREIMLAPSGSTVSGFNEFASGIFVNSDFVNPYGFDGTLVVNQILNIYSYFSIFLDLAALVITINVYISLFRRFWPQHHMLAGILSILGVFAPFVFAIRNKKPIEYIDYLRSRYNYTPHGPYYGPYGNPYQNPNGSQNPNRPPEHPFSEFAERGEVDPGDPFAEFSDDKKPTDKEDDR